MSIRTSTPFCKIRHERFAKRAVKISVHLGVLQEIAGIDSCMKIRLGKKSIIFAVNFTGARRPRRAGNGINEVSGLSQRFEQSGLSRA